MRILVLIHEYPPVGGGGGKVAQDLCRHLAQRGHAFRVLTARWGALPGMAVDEGVQVQRLASGRTQPFKAGLGAMAGYLAASFFAGLRTIHSWKPDLIHVHFAVPAGVAAWGLSRLTGVPYVLTAHLGDVPGGVPEKTGRWFRWIEPFTPPIWKDAARVVAVSHYTRDLALQHYPVPVEVILNGVDRCLLDPGEIRVGAPPQVVFAGRFMPQKNPLQVVHAMAGLTDLPWTCAMLGDGPLRPAVEAEIDRLGLRERFTLSGWIPSEQVIDWYRRSDILLMPSLSEGLPVVGVQAMSMGLALVLSRVGGNPELVENAENGCLLAPDDLPGFQAALRALLSNPARLLAARRASRASSTRFDLQAVVSAYEQIFQQAAGQEFEE